MLHQERVYAAVDLKRIRENFRNIRAHVRRKTEIMAVIKADGYGHGAMKIAQAIAAEEGLWGYAVATIDEALELTALETGKPILILGYCFPNTFQQAVNYGIRISLFDRKSAEMLSQIAGITGKTAYVHIKVDTGMGRIGIRPDEEGLAFVNYVNSLENIEIEGIFTHFARADETDQSAAKAQLKRYRDFTESLEAAGIHIHKKHCANSAAITAMEDTDYNIVRAGIILYGMPPSGEVDIRPLGIQPAMEIRSSIIFIKEVEPGTPISYGGTYVAKKKTRIATVSVGYADGYPRCLSDKGIVLIGGKRCKVTGRVCMDQMMVDISDVPEAYVGMPVTIVGRDEAEEITMEEFAALSERINYEAVCDIGKRVPRIYSGV